MTKLSPFQEQRAQEIEQDPKFSSWCVRPVLMISVMNDIPDMPPHPKLFCYYTTDGLLHLERVGYKEVIEHLTFS